MEKLKFESRNKLEVQGEKLDDLVLYFSQAINEQLRQFGATNFVDQNCAVNPRENFSTKNGGPYKKEELKADEKYVREHDELFAGIIDVTKDGDYVDNEKRIQYFRETFQCETREEMIAKCKQETRDSYGAILEKALVVNLNRVIGPKYMVLRSTTYDDYKNGVDYLIVDTETGIVACGFDGVNDAAGGERYEAKIKKIRQEAEHGGSIIKYGFTFDHDSDTGEKKLVKKQIENIPTFCLSLSRENLDQLLDNMNWQEGAEPNQVELNAFAKILSSLEIQAESFKSNRKISQAVRENLETFYAFLEDIKRIRQEKDTEIKNL